MSSNKFIAPGFAIKLAEMSLKFRMDYPESQRPMTSTGVRRAKQIINKKPFSYKDLIDTRSYLIRAKYYYKPSKRDSRNRYTKGTISYWSWGGESNNKMLRWVEDRLEDLGYFD